MYALTVPAEPDSLPVISTFIWAVAADAGLAQAKAYRLRLAMDEIATNILDHGYSANYPAEPIHIYVKLTPRTVDITIEDAGKRFDITQEAPAVDVNAPVEEREIGGLGVYLVVRYIDDIRYDYVNGHNVNRLIMMRE